MKIYTKRGDTGETDLFGGQRVLKNHVRVQAYGDIDTANSAIGFAYGASDLSKNAKKELLMIMRLLFCAGAEIATASKAKAQELLEKHLKNSIDESHVLLLEKSIDDMETKLSPLRNFILPCGSDAAGRLHLARNMVRKAEISLISLRCHNEHVRPEIIKFFNRLSDFLFVLARLANKEAQILDQTWSGNLDISK